MSGVIKKIDTKILLLGLLAVVFLVGLIVATTIFGIIVDIGVLLVSGVILLLAINSFTVTQAITNILFFILLLVLFMVAYQNPTYYLAWILFGIVAITAIFLGRINSILFFILSAILLAIYQNPTHSLAWVSLIIFVAIITITNKVGYAKNNSKLPGFGISLGLSLTYMSFLILIPLSALVLFSTQMPLEKFLETITDQRIIAALKVSFGASFIAALINCFFGLIIAWILARYDFVGRRIVDSIVDLPFAVPTAVAGISLAYIFSPNGVLGGFLQYLSEKLHSFALHFSPCAENEKCFRSSLENIDLNVAYSTTGIIIALVFIGLPFIVRTVQPVIEELDKELEEAASSLGANFYQIFLKVIFPAIYPALLTGFALAFARGLGEYGSVIFISSNIPYESEIVPLLIVKKLMQFDYVGASVIGVVMLVAAFVLLLIINFLQSFARRRKKGV
ncbi:MAG: ABC transporter permease subunit [Campylobacteraceae bacterium]|jgi:sulfate transport system permease protein|nr:ABC transporter permease subunit [Campylobacteraceae bacterium]